MELPTELSSLVGCMDARVRGEASTRTVVSKCCSGARTSGISSAWTESAQSALTLQSEKLRLILHLATSP